MTDLVTHPPYYAEGWSNGAEVIDITENLNGNGAQAVQYVARSTRSDGVVKGDRIEDLRKAEWYIRREIERLQGGGAPITDSPKSGQPWWIIEGPAQTSDWREFVLGTEFEDRTGDVFIRIEDGVVWKSDGHPATAIAYDTGGFAPYTEVLSG